MSPVFAQLHFDKPEWLAILGGDKAMIESPLIQRIGSELERRASAKLMLHILEGRFGSVQPSISAGLAQIKDEEKLLRLGLNAATCPTLQSFEDALRKELPAPAPASTRGKRRLRKSEGDKP